MTPASSMRRIVGALPRRRRPYALARFGILGARILEPISAALPSRGRVLDLGCGIGLLSSYLALRAPGRSVVGVEPSAAKVDVATAAAARLGLADNRYVPGTLGSSGVDGPFDAIVACDVLHHVPRSEQEAVLARFHELLGPGGVLVIKDVTTRPLHKHAFAYLTDLVMAGPNEAFSFRHHDDWSRLLRAAGFDVEVTPLRDFLPYAHVLFVARRR